MRNNRTSSRVPCSPFLPNVDIARYSFRDWVFQVGLRPEEQTSIWGLSKQGKTCKPCGLSVHSKCELKVKKSDCIRRQIADLGVRCLLTAINLLVDIRQSFLNEERHCRVRRPKVLLIVPIFSPISYPSRRYSFLLSTTAIPFVRCITSYFQGVLRRRIISRSSRVIRFRCNL